MTRNELSKAISDGKSALVLRYLWKKTEGVHFNELCRKLEGKVSRNTLFERLAWMEDTGIVESEMRRLDLAEFDSAVRVRRWIKHYGLPTRTRAAVESLWRLSARAKGR